MRSLLALALVAAPFAVIAAADGAAPAPAAADAKAVNTVCVMCGKPVDAKVAPIEGKTKDGKTVLIGTCSDACAAEVKKSANDYADAAVANKQWKKDAQV